MELPCITCKYRTESRSAHRTYVGCKDIARKKRHFVEDTFWYRHTCTGYVKDNSIEEEK